jgi:hypothetical protein
MKPGWRIVRHDGLPGLAELEADWRRLVAAMPDRGLPHSYEMHAGYCRHFPSARGAPVFLALSDGARVRAICPVEPQTLKVLGRATPVWGLPAGLGDVPRDLLCPHDEEAERVLLPAVTSFLRNCAPRGGWLVLERILETSTARRCLRHGTRRTYCTDVVGATGYIDVDRGFDALAAGLSRNFRGNLRNAKNRLTPITDVRVEHADVMPALSHAFADFLEVEASGWKGATGTRSAMALRAPQLAFHREMLDTVGRPDRCEISALYVEGKCIAAQFSLQFGEELSVLKVGFDEGRARYSPGQLLFERTLQRYCADDTIKRVSMVGDAPWIMAWKPELVPTYTAYIALGPLTGPLLVQLQRIRIEQVPRLKRLLQRLRAK